MWTCGRCPWMAKVLMAIWHTVLCWADLQGQQERDFVCISMPTYTHTTAIKLCFGTILLSKFSHDDGC